MNDKVEYVTTIISNMIRSMPMDNDEISRIVKSLVDESFIPPSWPSIVQNYLIRGYLKGINEEIRKIKQ